jgi:hypothetical protein
MNSGTDVEAEDKGKSHPLPPMQLPLRFRNLHEQLLVLDWNPACKHLHRVLEIAVKENLPSAINERRRSGVQDIEAAAEGSVFGWFERGIRVPEEHEDVPDAELCREGDGVVEEGEVPAGAVGGGLDIKPGLGVLVMKEAVMGEGVLRVS